MSLRLTATGWLFLGMVGLFYGASITSQSGLLLAPAGIILGCFLVNGVAAWRAVRRLAMSAPATAHVVEGHRLDQPWQLRNTGDSDVALVTAESAAGRLFRLTRLAGGTKASVVPELQFHRRGVFPHDQLRLTTAFPFGLVRAARQFALRGEVVVHPAVYPVPPPSAAGFDVMVGGKFRGQRQTGTGDQFSGIRPHQAGDSLRQIHWASSAKGQGLMVKTFAEELSGRVAVVLDCGSSGVEQDFEDAVRAAGSLAFAALDAGHHVEWLDLAAAEPESCEKCGRYWGIHDSEGFCPPPAAEGAADVPLKHLLEELADGGCLGPGHDPEECWECRARAALSRLSSSAARQEKPNA